MYDHYIYIKEQYPIPERLVPRIRVLEALPWWLKKKIYIDSSAYMLKSFLYTQFRHWSDPLYHFSIEEFFKYVTSFVRREFDLIVVHGGLRKIRQSSHQILCVGHTHEAVLRRVGKNKYYMNTGNWRDEYRISPAGRYFMPKRKGYGYILHSSYQIKECQLFHVPSRQKPISMRELKVMLRMKKH